MPGNMRITVLASTSLRLNCTFCSIMSEAQAATKLIVLPSSLFALIRHRANLPVIWSPSIMKPPPDLRHLGEAHLRALANEDLGTIVGVARPGTVEIEGNGGAGHNNRRAHSSAESAAFR